MFTIDISCFITSNLHWFMDITPQVPMQYCSLQQSEFASTTSHIHNWVLLFLWLCLFIVSGVISPLISSSILGTHWLIFLIFLCPFFLLFSYCSWGSQGKNIEVICHSLLQWTTFSQSYPLWPVHWVRQGCGMWSYWLVFCDCGFHSAYSLMEKYKRLMEASWRERLTEGETVSCSDGWGRAQLVL